MKNTSLIMAGVAAAFVGLGAIAQANPISGAIDMTGPAIIANNDLAGATGASFVPPVTVTYASGAYSGVPAGTVVNFAPFINWTPPSTPIDLWQFNSGFWSYSFRVTSLSVISQSSTDLELSGAGIAYITGIASTTLPTLATWSLSITQDPGSNTGYTFNFYDPIGGPHGPQVPDGGTTAVLLGASLAGLGLVRKKLLV